MAIAALLPATLRNVLSALWRAQRRTWKATYFSLCPAAWQKSAWSYKKNASWLTVSYSNSLWAFARFIFSVYFHVLPHFSSSPWIHSQLLPAAQLPEVLPNEVTFSGLFFVLFFWPPSISVLLPHLQPSKPPTGRQLWIIKWWIRAYFLPTQTGDCWASSSAIGLIPLSTRNSTKSHRCLSSFGRKTVDSPAHPHVSSTPGSTRLGSSRLKFLQ